MRYSDFLCQNATIGFIAPAFGCTIEPYQSAFKRACEKFRQLGHQWVLGPNCYENKGVGISNVPALCAKEFVDMWTSNECDVLLSCGGGELMCEILEHIDFEIIRTSKPKWFMGYSDNTNLSFLLATLCDTASIYGPNAPAFGMEPWHKAIQDAYALLCGEQLTTSSYDGWERESKKSAEKPYEPYHITEKPALCAKHAKEPFTGRLLGGCLDVISNLVGTRYDKVNEFIDRYAEDGIIWFLEACDLSMMGIRRALWQLDQAGYFRHAKGFLIGRPLHFDEEELGQNRYAAVLAILGQYKLPIVMDVDLGHLPPAMPLINGSLATVTVQEGALTVQMKLD